MTYSDPRKIIIQLQHKPGKLRKYLKHNMPRKRTGGRLEKRCERCGNPRGHIGKYGLNLCRRCFREIAHELGFEKYE